VGSLVGFFLGSAGWTKALLLVAVSGWLAALAGYGTMLYWRGEYRAARAEVAVLQAKAWVLAEATRSCSAGVDLARETGEAAVRNGAALLAEARRLHGRVPPVVARLEDLLKQKPPARDDGSPADCRDAWLAIEREEQKAGGAR
jgi:hypothetical protein